MTQQGIRARAHDRILKVAPTIGDLEAPIQSSANIAEAIQYRSLDRNLPGMKLVHSVLVLILGGAALQRCDNRRRMSGFSR
jgi:hypothetical protein